MRSFLVAFRLALRVIVAVVARAVHRLRHGPAVASWGWQVELRLAAFKAFLDAARAHPDPLARRRIEERIDPPLPRRLRGVLTVREESLAGVATERHVANGMQLPVTILYFHGGGYIAGSAATHRRWVANLSWALGAEAHVPNYGLAPEQPFPAALDDATAVYKALLADGVNPGALFVAGDSAGGGLAVALLLRLRDHKEQLPAGAILFSPYTDLEHTAPSIEQNRTTDYLPYLSDVPANTLYLGNHDPTDPYASPIHGDFTGIPPLVVFAGGREMIRDDATRLVDAATRDGCRAELHLAPDMYHVWPALLPNHPETLRALSISNQFVRSNQR